MRASVLGSIKYMINMYIYVCVYDTKKSLNGILAVDLFFQIFTARLPVKFIE